MKARVFVLLVCVFVVMIGFGIIMPVLPFYAERLALAGGASRQSVVMHVGLYIGDGKFIHSARGGVRISALSSSDPIGKWWFARWVGARRLR